MMRAFQALTLHACDLLQRSIASGKRIPVKCTKRLFNVPRAGRGISSGHAPDIERFLNQHRQVLLSSQQAQACVDALVNDPRASHHLNHMVGSFSSYHRIEVPQVIVKFLETYIVNQDSFEFSQETFLRAYGVMENYFYSEHEDVEVYIPLENFSADTDITNLGNGWSIRRIPAQQINEIASFDDSPFSFISLMHLNFALYWHGRVLKVITPEVGSSDEAPETTMARLTPPKIVTALRLFKQGVVGYRMNACRRVGWSFSGESRSTSSDTKHLAGMQYQFKESEVQEFKALLDVVLSLPERTIVDVAIRRLNLANERGDQYDKMIDLMIGFESLYIKKRESIRLNLSSRVAANLHTQGFNITTVSRHMKSAYDIRSQIVHGFNEPRIRELLRPTDFTLRQFVNKIEVYLRESTKCYLNFIEKGLELEQILTELDSRPVASN